MLYSIKMYEVIGEVYHTESFVYQKCVKCLKKTVKCCSDCGSERLSDENLCRFKIINSTRNLTSNEIALTKQILNCTLIGKSVGEGLYRLKFKRNTISTGKLFVDDAVKVFEESVDQGLCFDFENIVNVRGSVLESESELSILDSDLINGFEELDITLTQRQMVNKGKRGELHDLTNLSHDYSTQDAIDVLNLMGESQ